MEGRRMAGILGLLRELHSFEPKPFGYRQVFLSEWSSWRSCENNQGLALTAANYKVAIDLLRGRFGKPVVIERAHVNELLNVAPVFNERDTAGFRRLYDKIEIHHRGLKALEVDASTYEGIVVPAILRKLPEAVKLQITRGKNHTEWKMEDLLQELLSELE